MIAIEIAEIGGGPEVLKPVQLAVPVPQAGDVLVRMRAAGINRGDMGQRKGSYPPPKGVTAIPGLEVAGEIVQVGAEARRWKPGDQVCALLAGGGYAEYCVIPEGQCLPIPAGLSFVQAASLPETCATVWDNVWRRAGIRIGETLLVHGGTSGIGVTAIQLGVALGHPVIATAGSDDKRDFCRDLGTEAAINYRTQDFVAECRAATGGRGADVILDMVGGPYLGRDLKALADEGRLVFIAYQQGRTAELDIGEVMFRRLTVTGSTLRARPVGYKAELLRQVEEIVWPLVAAGRVKPIIHATFPLTEAHAAHALMEGGNHIGKIVLTND